MEGGQGGSDLRHEDSGFMDFLFSWSLDDVFNEDLYRNQVEEIPGVFESFRHYFKSFIFPLLEETRASLHSSMEAISCAPYAEVIAMEESKPYGNRLYDVRVDTWKNRFSERGKEPYKTLPGDILILSDAKSEVVDDLKRIGRTWSFATVTKITDDEDRKDSTSTSTYFKIKGSIDMDVKDGMQGSMFAVFLINTTTHKRIWKALHMHGNMKIVKEILRTDSAVENCTLCNAEDRSILDVEIHTSLKSNLNESQSEAVLACLDKMQCDHKPAVELIWGPPGTGKTKTVSMFLFTVLKKNCRTITCAPTNVAINEVASRVLKLVKESDSGYGTMFCSLGNILLFGNKERLNVGSDIEEIYMDHRIQKLSECFGPMTGWLHCFTSMINFLEDCVSHYHIHVENELIRQNQISSDSEIQESVERNGTDEFKKCESFLEFIKGRFISHWSPLKRCTFIFCTHISKTVLMEANFQDIISLVRLLDSFETELFRGDVISEELEELFSCPVTVDDPSLSGWDMSSLQYLRIKCLHILKGVRDSLLKLNLPSSLNKYAIQDFCFQSASLIFCTASSSYKLHSVKMEPLELLVIDEAAQLKECESAIPLQLRGVKHAILIGDECQLPAMVESEVSREAGFGRSLFERLSSLGHSKHLLDVQYRMHPKISFFPNAKFYNNHILDAPNVKSRHYEKSYLQGPMFGPYSFINVYGGREEKEDGGHSLRNMVEVAVVLKLVRNLYKAWSVSTQTFSIGIISPYAAQVAAIKDKTRQKYEKLDGFSVKVKTVDGFQGGEEDIIIISTVRSNSGGKIGFLSKPQRTNVALTRARHCLWIVGNGKTLANSESIGEELVRDAKDRQCFFDAGDDKELAKAILEVKKEYDQLDDLIKGDSVLFKNAVWKVLFSDFFRKSFGKLRQTRTKASVLNLLLRLSNGWRPKKKNVDSVCESSSHIIKQFKVEGLYIVCTIDILKESRYTQVLKVWDILQLEEIPKLVKRLDNIFQRYTDDFITRCNEKYLQGDIEAPMTWGTSADIVRYTSRGSDETGSSLNDESSDKRCYVENSKVSESLLLMKFYSLSSGVVRHMLSDSGGRELDLPFEVTDQEMEIIQFHKSTFILGRSGTGKTTVLTMKLFQKEQQHQIATEGLNEGSSGVVKDVRQSTNISSGEVEVKRTILRQLFVTVSPKLCYAVKQHVSQLKSFVRSGEYSAESSGIELDEIDDVAQSRDIQDSLVDISPNLYPIVITFHKFLMMLDGTLGNSFFERFPDAREFSHGEGGRLRSVALQTFLRTKEVNYDKFCLDYWPRFNDQLKKKFDASRVFTEIISHIKGGFHAGETFYQRLKREDYVRLSDARISTLSMQKRKIIYDLFLAYEKMKAENGEFDLADLVIDLHRRLKEEKYEGDIMDFVYIDEVQDLTMRQIALFKYVCHNVKEGFVFSGDTAQTIARGIDFRFEDIRSLFYNAFMLESRSNEDDGRKDKGQISQIFKLSQNFRTHAGVLSLAQSIVDLLYRFFPLFIDILSPETSLIYGEPPILLESGSDENAIVTIFGNSGNVGGNMVGFGAEQVILVRDDCARKEISNYVGKQALVLTIVECKGLEFQDVLLYNFFGSSPLKNQWRVIYEYMKEQDMLDVSSSPSFPNFNAAKHNVLCSELKQLYVAITRTRQRLWVCENKEELSRPVFDYWKKLCLVQIRKLDNSLAQAMQVASSPEEWKSRGYKLLREGNYQMATMCFERAGDKVGENLSKAAGLDAEADRLYSSNPEMSCIVRRQAAEIFDSIGKAEHAARCFYMLKEYERAGKIYLKCGESALVRAGECFSLCGCYELAADVYARGNHFSECLSACSKGKLFDAGLRYIGYWKQHANADDVIATRTQQFDRIEQDFLESCALQFHELKDNRAMMKFVKAFSSSSSMRTFLKKLDCLEELLLLEEELGNFVEAANIAKLIGDLPLEADLLGKAGHFSEASMLILWYVFASSLWQPGSKGWPLKQFAKAEELLAKAKSFAQNESDQFYPYVCAESTILSNKLESLFEMKEYMSVCHRHENVRGEILCARMVLDALLSKNASKYGWKSELVLDLQIHAEDSTSQDEVSVETIVYFWRLWKEKIVNIFESLEHLETEDGNEYKSYGEFCLNYFGVWKCVNNLSTMFVLHNPNADWVKELDGRVLRRNGKLVFIDLNHFVSVARSYWSLELRSVGMKVFDKLEALYKLSTLSSLPVFWQYRSLTLVYEVAKYVLECKYLGRKSNNTIQKFVEVAIHNFFGYIFPLDWRQSSSGYMIDLRGTDVSRNLQEEFICANVSWNNRLSHGQIGRVAVAVLGLSKVRKESYEKIARKFDENPAWKAFIEILCGVPSQNTGSPRELSLITYFHAALFDTFNANWRVEADYISPGCFLYLLEHLLVLSAGIQGYFFATKSSYVEWLNLLDANPETRSRLVLNMRQFRGVQFICDVVVQLLINKGDTKEWLRKFSANVMKDYQLVVLRLFIILCLLHVNFGLYSEVLYDLLGKSYITQQLPPAFYDALRRRGRRDFLNVLADACKIIDNPLVIVNLNKNCANTACMNAIYVDMKVKQSKEDILRVLFPKIIASPRVQIRAVEVESTTGSSNEVLPSESKQPSSGLAPEQQMSMKLSNNPSWFWDMLEELKSVNNKTDEERMIEKCMVKFITLITAAKNAQNGTSSFDCDVEDGNSRESATSLLDELKQLVDALVSPNKGSPEDNAAIIRRITDKILSRREELEPQLITILKIIGTPETEIASEGGNPGEETDEKTMDDSKLDNKVEVQEVAVEAPEAAMASKGQDNLNKKKAKKKPNKGKKGGKGGKRK